MAAGPALACGVCGAACRAGFVAPPPELAPDLDFRPGEPTRSTLGRWVQTCRGCGACAPELARLPGRLREVVEGDAYRAVRGAALRWAMLAEAQGEAGLASDAVLQAAWAADDAGDDAAARGLRVRAAALAGEPATVQDGLRLVDVLRRAGMAEAARARAEALLAGLLEETDGALLRYQLGLLDGGDAGRHLLSSALRPPAQRPHVTQNRAAPGKPVGRPGLWRRLLGG